VRDSGGDEHSKVYEIEPMLRAQGESACFRNETASA
jgi:hypothetical protein